MNANFDDKLFLVAQGLSMNIALNTTSEICGSNWVMTTQKTIVDIFLNDFQTSTSHVCFSYGLNFLKPVLFTKWVESIVDTVKKFNKLSASILLNNLIETFDVNKNDRYLALGFREIFLAILNSWSH